MQLLEEKRKLTIEKQTLQANVAGLQGDKRRLEGRAQVLTAGKQQRTVDGMLSRNRSKKLANSYAEPRDVVQSLGIKSPDGLPIPRAYLRKTKYEEPVKILKTDHIRVFQRLMHVCDTAVMSVLNGLHSIPAEATTSW